MKAVRLHGYGGIDQLRYEDVPTPEPGASEVLVKVAGTSVNPIDWKLRRGEAKDRMPLTLPAVLGRDVAGSVVKVGSHVRTLKPGQNVMGLVTGSYSEYLTAQEDSLTVIPDGVDVAQAAVLPLVVTTGAQLIQHLRPKRDDVILVTGALGSVGRSAVYFAIQQGAWVIAGVRMDQKAEASLLSANQIVAIDDEAEIAELQEFDAIADTVGHGVIGKLIQKLKSGGILGSVLGKPKEAEEKNIHVEAFMAHPDASLLRQMADAVRDGKLTIPIARRMKLSEAGEAQTLSEKGGIRGKILLVP